MVLKSMVHQTMVFLLLFILTALSPATAHRRRPTPHRPIRAGYYPSWLNPTFPPSAIDVSLFTHVLYAFVQPDPTTFHLVITSADDAALANFTAIRPAKTLLSIGGGGSRAATFAAIAGNQTARAAFIRSTISVARRYNLDGLDLDWEFPEDPTQMANLAELCAEWRAAVEAESSAAGRPRLLLTAAVYFASHFFLSGAARSYPAAAMGRALDWVSPMCFDYHGGWDTSATGLHAALYDAASNVSGSYGVGSWLAAGVAPGKLVMGMPLYGRTWRLRDAAVNGVGAPAVGVGPGESDGTMVYSKVVEFNVAKGAAVVEDAAAVAAYSFSGTDWIGYDDPKSVAGKVRFARRLRLGGYFFWALGYDDSSSSVSKAAFEAWRR